MTDLSLSPARAASPTRRVPWPLILYAAVGTAAVAGFVGGRLAGAETGGMEWQLVFLLRFMAAVKGAMVLGALGLAQWRLRRPASDRLAAGYALALVAMAAAPGLIWSLARTGGRRGRLPCRPDPLPRARLARRGRRVADTARLSARRRA